LPAYSGKFQYTSDPLREGPCQFSFSGDTASLTPQSGSAITFDLGDVDLAVKNEWDLQLTLFTGRRLTLKQFGSAFDRMAGELIAAWRDRTVRCMVLEDLEPVGTYTGVAGTPNPEPAEIRVFKSNVAILPLASTPYQWRLAAVDGVSFDDASYSITLRSGDQQLKIGKLGKKTDELRDKLQTQYDAIRQQSAEAMHATFPFLDPDRLEQLLAAMPEGRSVSLGRLSAIDPALADAMIARGVSESLRPYFDVLKKRALTRDSIMSGYKFIRPDEVEESDTPQDPDQPPLFFWFFFPLAGGVAAWEASTGGGRATYFFRIDTSQPEASIAKLTNGLALVNFRREPVYLSDTSLAQQKEFHRYAIGARKLPDLRTLRAAFIGRAMHSDVEKWTAQMDVVLGKTAAANLP
jgi:hypothetical protein